VKKQRACRMTRLAQAVAIAVLLALPLITGCGSTGVSDPGSGSGQTVSATISPSSLSFGNATVGTTSTKTVVVTNTGTANVVVSAINLTGSGFSVSGVTLPLTIAPGASYTANVVFSPQSVGAASGSASIVSNLSSSPNVVTFTGTGVSTPVGLLNASPNTVAFGNVTVGTSSAQNLKLSNSGTASVTVSSINVTGAGFSINAATPFSVAAGGSTSVAVTFSPTASGVSNGTATISSDAGNGSVTASLSGTGTTTVTHSVSLSWAASASLIAGYNVYRGTHTGGPYQRVNSTVQPSLAYTDSGVSSGQTYYYVVTAVDSTGLESVFSNEAVAIVP